MSKPPISGPGSGSGGSKRATSGPRRLPGGSVGRGAGPPANRRRLGPNAPPSLPAAAPAPRAVNLSPSRTAAFEILLAVATTEAHSDDLLHGIALRDLSPADRALATTLVMGVLRWQIALDARLREWLQRPDLALAVPLQVVLRLGAFQLLHLDRVPAHAVLSQSVELARFAGQPHAAGMVNAVLRKLTHAPAPRTPVFETTAALAERLAHPVWLVERWSTHFGRAAAGGLCGYDQTEPTGGGLFPDSETLPRMDDGSRLVAELAAASQPKPQRIWDCCAAPGGKTMILANRHTHAEILATDLSTRRLEAMRRRLSDDPLSQRVTFETADARDLPEAAGLFDLILCDVPCSGTGTLARNPEIRERLAPADLPRQAERQREILRGALRRLAPGGSLLYSTCSLEPEEGEDVVRFVTTESSGIARVDLAGSLSALADRGVLAEGAFLDEAVLLRDGALRTLPGVNFAGDGFFAALLRRLPA